MGGVQGYNPHHCTMVQCDEFEEKDNVTDLMKVDPSLLVLWSQDPQNPDDEIDGGTPCQPVPRVASRECNVISHAACSPARVELPRPPTPWGRRNGSKELPRAGTLPRGISMYDDTVDEMLDCFARRAHLTINGKHKNDPSFGRNVGLVALPTDTTGPWSAPNQVHEGAPSPPMRSSPTPHPKAQADTLVTHDFDAASAAAETEVARSVASVPPHAEGADAAADAATSEAATSEAATAAPPLDLSDLVGVWTIGAPGAAVKAVVHEGGKCLYNGAHYLELDLAATEGEGGTGIERADGHKLDMEASSRQVLVWRRPGNSAATGTAVPHRWHRCSTEALLV